MHQFAALTSQTGTTLSGGTHAHLRPRLLCPRCRAALHSPPQAESKVEQALQRPRQRCLHRRAAAKGEAVLCRGEGQRWWPPGELLQAPWQGRRLRQHATRQTGHSLECRICQQLSHHPTANALPPVPAPMPSLFCERGGCESGAGPPTPMPAVTALPHSSMRAGELLSGALLLAPATRGLANVAPVQVKQLLKVGNALRGTRRRGLVQENRVKSTDCGCIWCTVWCTRIRLCSNMEQQEINSMIKTRSLATPWSDVISQQCRGARYKGAPHCARTAGSWRPGCLRAVCGRR